MTTIIKTIGANPGRDFPATLAGLQAAWDSIPADVVGSGNNYEIQFGNESEIVFASKFTFAGKSCDASHRIRVCAVPGGSFTEHVNVLTNAYSYNPANGAAVRCTENYSGVFEIDQDFLTLEGLQLWESGGGNSGHTVAITQNGPNSLLQNLIVRRSGSGYYMHALQLAAGSARNILAELLGATSGAMVFGGRNDARAENITAVRPANIVASHPAFVTFIGGKIVLKNCVAFGFDSFTNNVDGFTGSHNASNVSIGFGSDNKEGLLFADQFVDVSSSANGDYRLKSGSALIDAGTAPSLSNIMTVSGPRQQGMASDIGAWEVPSEIQSPTANITSILVSGQSVTISGTTTGKPTDGACLIQPAATAYNNAVAQGPVALVLADGKFQAQFTGVKVGRYSVSISVKNAYYETVGTNSVGDFSSDGALATSVVQEPIDGQVLTVHGTTSGNPTSGVLVVPAAAGNPEGAVDQAVPVTLGAGTFTVSVSLPAGNYDAGRLTFTTAAGTSLPQPGTRPVVILGISGNPTVPDDDPDAAKTASIQLVSTSGIPIDAGPVLKFAWFDQATPDLFDTPTDTGTVVVGDGGTLKVALANSLKVSGQVGWLVVSNSDGDPAAVHKAFSGPVKVD